MRPSGMSKTAVVQSNPAKSGKLLVILSEACEMTSLKCKAWRPVVPKEGGRSEAR